MPRLYGVPTPVVRKLSSEFFQKIKKKPKQGILQLCNELLKSGYSEERTIAFDWAFRLFETWLTEHMYGWGACDDLARA